MFIHRTEYQIDSFFIHQRHIRFTLKFWGVSNWIEAFRRRHPLKAHNSSILKHFVELRRFEILSVKSVSKRSVVNKYFLQFLLDVVQINFSLNNHLTFLASISTKLNAVVELHEVCWVDRLHRRLLLKAVFNRWLFWLNLHALTINFLSYCVSDYGVHFHHFIDYFIFIVKSLRLSIHHVLILFVWRDIWAIVRVPFISWWRLVRFLSTCSVNHIEGGHLSQRLRLILFRILKFLLRWHLRLTLSTFSSWVFRILTYLSILLVQVTV